MDNTPGRRLILFRETAGLTQQELADQLKVSRSSVALVEGNSRPPSRAFLQAISVRYGLSSDWLLNGQGEMLSSPKGFGGGTSPRIDPPNPDRPLQGDFAADGHEYNLIRRLDLSVSAGSGLIPVEDGETERLAFSRSWLARMGVPADLSALVRVKGDSMAPSIPDGALVLLNAAEMGFKTDGVYAFTRDGAAYIKRLVRLAPGKDGRFSGLVIISDNPVYRPEVLSGAAMNDIRIVGKVRCVIAAL